MLTSEHGLAQKRARLYLAGVRMDSLSQTVTLDDLWPKPLQHEANGFKLTLCQAGIITMKPRCD